MDSAQDERNPPKRKRIDSIHQESPPSEPVDIATNVHLERPQSHLADKGSDAHGARPQSAADIGSNNHRERPQSDHFEINSNVLRESPGSDRVDISSNDFNVTDRTADAAITSTEDALSVIESISAREAYLNDMKERTLRMLDEIAPAQRRRRTRRRRRPKPAGAPAPALAPAPASTVAPAPAGASTPVPPGDAEREEGELIEEEQPDGAGRGAWWAAAWRAGVLRNASAAPREPRVVRPLLAP